MFEEFVAHGSVVAERLHRFLGPGDEPTETLTSSFRHTIFYVKLDARNSHVVQYAHVVQFFLGGGNSGLIPAQTSGISQAIVDDFVATIDEAIAAGHFDKQKKKKKEKATKLDASSSSPIRRWRWRDSNGTPRDWAIHRRRYRSREGHRRSVLFRLYRKRSRKRERQVHAT